jgi:hypothetical protein
MLFLSEWLCFRKADAIVKSALETESPEDGRPSILFFRSFQNDGAKIDRSHSIDRIAVEELWYVGPTRAIGDPNNATPPIGALRDYVKDEAWQAYALHLMDSAKGAVVALGDTEGLTWEIDQLLARPLMPTLFVALPKHPPSSHSSQRLFGHLKKGRNKLFGVAHFREGEIAFEAPLSDERAYRLMIRAFGYFIASPEVRRLALGLPAVDPTFTDPPIGEEYDAEDLRFVSGFSS